MLVPVVFSCCRRTPCMDARIIHNCYTFGSSLRILKRPRVAMCLTEHLLTPFTSSRTIIIAMPVAWWIT